MLKLSTKCRSNAPSSDGTCAGSTFRRHPIGCSEFNDFRTK